MRPDGLHRLLTERKKFQFLSRLNLEPLEKTLKSLLVVAVFVPSLLLSAFFPHFSPKYFMREFKYVGKGGELLPGKTDEWNFFC